MCRVPFGLMPVMAATAVRSTARPSHASQLIIDDSIHVDPALRTPFGRKWFASPATSLLRPSELDSEEWFANGLQKRSPGLLRPEQGGGCKPLCGNSLDLAGRQGFE